MLEDMIQLPEQFSFEEISSPFSAQILEICNTELSPEPVLQNSEVVSSSNCCYEENSSYTPNLYFPLDINKFTNTIQNNGTTTTGTINNNSNPSRIFDSPEEIENDISASIDFSPSPPFSIPSFITPQQEQFDLTSLQCEVPVTDVVNRLPLVGPPLTAFYDEEVLASMPSYVPLNPSSPSCSFLDHPTLPYLSGNPNAASSAENSGIFTGSILVGTELHPQELEFEGDNGGIFCPEPLPQIVNSSELQALGNETQHLVSGSGSGSSTPLASDISSLGDSTFKVGKLSLEQRKEKIHKYLKKRNERNFSKKIKVVLKEEDSITSDIFARVSGVNSFKCNYDIQSWI